MTDYVTTADLRREEAFQRGEPVEKAECPECGHRGWPDESEDGSCPECGYYGGNER